MFKSKQTRILLLLFVVAAIVLGIWLQQSKNDSQSLSQPELQSGSASTLALLNSEIPTLTSDIQWGPTEIASHEYTRYVGDDLERLTVPGHKRSALNVDQSQYEHWDEIDAFLRNRGWELDSGSLADGPTAHVWGYKRLMGSKLQIIVFTNELVEYQGEFPSNVSCPCRYKDSVFLSSDFIDPGNE